jgi:adenosyl cobinamide kinase/adenosyl cobinamide phosphate guanylyltransferase
MSKVEEFIAETKLNDLLHKKEAESQKNKGYWQLLEQWQQLQESLTQCIVSLHRIIWKSLKMILTMTSMIISAKTIRCKKLFAKVKQNIQAECG